MCIRDRFWDGEDGAFDLNTITEAELRQFPNLKHITLMSSKPEQVLPVLERCGICLLYTS